MAEEIAPVASAMAPVASPTASPMAPPMASAGWTRNDFIAIRARLDAVARVAYSVGPEAE